MTAAATTSRTSRTSRPTWSSSHSTTTRSSTTPSGHPTRTPAASVGQAVPPLLSPHNFPGSPRQQDSNGRSSSPSYFGLAVTDQDDNPTNSDAGEHARKNWKSPSSSARSRHVDAQTTPHEANPSLAAFRKQSESKVFQLDTGSSIASVTSPRSSASRKASQFSPTSSRQSPKHLVRDVKDSSDEAESMDVDMDTLHMKSPLKRGISSTEVYDESQFGLPRRESPANLPTLNSLSQKQLSDIDNRHPRLSLPHLRTEQRSPPKDENALGRSSTLPSELQTSQPQFLSSGNLAELLESTPEDGLLLLDLRVSPQFAQSRVRGALNLCIPTTLLKRPSFNVQKLLETFTSDSEKQKFSKWKDMQYIVMYDANSSQMKDATSALNTIKKFVTEGWHGIAYIVRGGYAEISKRYPSLVESSLEGSPDQSGQKHLTLNARGTGAIQVAGGLSMPSGQSAANPFFGNIRQNEDLVDGVGQLPIKHPELLTHKGFKLLPAWLQNATEELNKGKAVSDFFLGIEKAEQERMQSALTTNVVYGTPGPNAAKQGFQVAGIEKGTKNRYKNILPFDHSRVKLQDVPASACDYVNASHIEAEWSNRQYIASQAPMPATFEDFWRVVWEQDVRVIVMLSAETEGGQRKCHPYWVPETYGAMKVKSISEKKIVLRSDSTLNLATPSNFKSPLLTPQPERSTPRRQRAVTEINPFGNPENSKDIPEEVPYIVVRTLTLSHNAYPFQQMREICQIHYSGWPDFGAPAHAADLLALVERTNTIIRKYNGTSNADAHLPAPPDERPILVHCSAGCGRTGTFCTVDSVIDMLKRQRQAQKAPKAIVEGDEMEIDEEAWVGNDEVDLIAKTVDNFRHQRLSMVQTLRQYVLCYETILEWIVKEMPEKFRRETLRRSFGG